MAQELRAADLGGGRRPWTLAGGRDPDFDDIARTKHQTLLTDASLLTCFRRRFPERGLVDYDEMVRCLGFVWDCPHDGSANVTGYRCADCGRTRAAATDAGAAGPYPEPRDPVRLEVAGRSAKRDRFLQPVEARPGNDGEGAADDGGPG